MKTLSSLKKIAYTILAITVILLCSTVVNAGTKTWNNPSGGLWSSDANWLEGSVPVAGDDIIFNVAGTYTVTGVPTLSVGTLTVNAGADVTLQAATTNTLTINGSASNTNFFIEDGASLSNTAASVLSITVASNTQFSDISGTLSWYAGTISFQSGGANSATVKSTGIVNHYGGTVTGSAATLIFSAGAVYNYLGTAALTIPAASWDAASDIYISGITSAATIGGSAQSFGNVTYNCASQGNVAVTFAATSSTRFKGDFNLISTGGGTGSVSFKNSTSTVNLYIDGAVNISGGTLNANIGGTSALNLYAAGDFNFSNGTFNISTAATACNVYLSGNYNQTGGTFTQTSSTVSTVNFKGTGKTYNNNGGTVTNTYINYLINTAGASLTLLCNITVPSGRNFTVTNGTLYCGTNIISGAGSFVLTSAATAAIGIGSQTGIATSGATGNIQTTTRTYGALANYIYTGTDGQITGNGLPAACTGYIMISLLNSSDQITFTTATLTGSGVTVRMVNGALANTIVYPASSTLSYEFLTPQNTSSNEFPAVTGPRNLTMNSPSVVTLHASRTLPTSGILTMTNGILVTTSANILIVSYNSATAVVGGSATSYVNGPLQRQFANTASGTYKFPVGKTAYNGIDIVLNGTTGSTLYAQAEYFETPPGGTAGTGITSLGSGYWEVIKISGSGNIPQSFVTLYQAGVGADDRGAYSSTLTGTYNSVGGAGNGTSITSAFSNSGIGYFTIGPAVILSGVITVGSSGANFSSLTNSDGLFAAINQGPLYGNLIVHITSDLTSESGTDSLTQWTESGGSNYTVTIMPDGNTLRTIQGNYQGTNECTGGLFRLEGVARVTFDGRDPYNLPGGGRFLLFRNTNKASTYYQSTFSFLNGCNYDTLRYIITESAAYMYNVGVIRVGKLTAGNNNLLIDHCHIRSLTTTSDAVGSGIYAEGVSAAQKNTGITISNNDIYNIWRNSGDNGGIYLSSYCSDWTITGNHFYLNSSVTVSNNNTKYGIYISNTGQNYIINDNYFGGSAPYCGGTPFTYADLTGDRNVRYCGIYFNPNAGAAGCEIKNNKINNFIWKQNSATLNSVVFTGIYNLNGNTEINNNTIGAVSGNDSIIINCGNFGDAATAQTLFSYGIRVDAGDVSVKYNNIGAVKTASATTAPITLSGISITGTGTANVTGNLVGSLTTPLSINTTNTGICNYTGDLFCIYLGSTGTTVADSNIVANVHHGNNFYYSPQIIGIISELGSTNGAVTISNNKIYALSCIGDLNQYGQSAPNIGIKLYHQGTNAVVCSVKDNLVYDLKCTTSSTGNKGVCGISCQTNQTSTPVEVTRNFIHSLYLTVPTDGSSIMGMYFGYGKYNVSNNMIRLGIDANGNSITKYDIRGISYLSTAQGNFYFNTVYLGGSDVASSTVMTYAFARLTNTAVLNLKNNIFINERSNSTGTGSHFATGLNSITNVTSNYNDLYTPGTGGNIGEIGGVPYATLADWQPAIPGDANSVNSDVLFIDDVGPASTVDLHIDQSQPSAVESAGITGTGINDDYDLDIRFGSPGYGGNGTAPDIGADEIGAVCIPVAVTADPSNPPDVCEGTNVSDFTVQVSGMPDYDYQWQVNTGSGWTNLSNGGVYGTTAVTSGSSSASNTLTITNADASYNGYQYRCIINNSCSGDTSDYATFTVNTLPYPYFIYGGGSYCSETPGINIGLFGSDVGISYQLMYEGNPLWSPVTGDGYVFNFGIQTQAGNYTAVATDPATGCQNNMSGDVDISIYNCAASEVSVAINITGAQADTAAILDVSDTISGILFPSLNNAERDAVNYPDDGLIIYNTSSATLNYFFNGEWYEVSSSSVYGATSGTAINYGTAVNSSGALPAASAMLDVNSNIKGALIPRTLPGAIYGAKEGSIIFNIYTNKINYFNGTAWFALTGGAVSSAFGTGSQTADGCAVNMTNAGAAASAILDVAAQNKALLITRLTDGQRNNITPATGLIIYNTSAHELQYYSGSGWMRMW